jgi:hypothetical protein
MKVLKVITMASAFCFAFAGICLAAVLVPEGTVTAINAISSPTPVTNLAFSSLGNDVTIATITIDNNYENAFDLKLDFTNDGVFTRVAAAGGDGITVTSGVGAEIPITQFTLAHGSGTLGTGLSAPDGTFTLSGSGPATYTWDTGAKQSTATVGYQVVIKADWAADTRLLQGTYRETLTATLTVGDGL